MTRNVVILAVALAFVAITNTTQAQQVDLGTAADDVWAHIRAADPGGDAVIRCWGAQGLDLNPTGYPGAPGTDDFFSYGYLKWDVSDIPPDYVWRGATVTLTIADGSLFDPAQDSVFLRGITGPFDEDTWAFGDPPAPIAAARLQGTVNGSGVAGDTITFRIPRNVPKSILNKWAKDRAIYIMISSDADVLATGRFLRFASNDNLIFDGPQLVLD